MQVAVKYCGGCNASYDRGALVAALRSEFPNITIVNAEAGSESPADLALIVCGCSCVCASHEHLNAKHGKVFTACESDIDSIRQVIRNIMAQA